MGRMGPIKPASHTFPAWVAALQSSNTTSISCLKLHGAKIEPLMFEMICRLADF
jgi:hypothetical protein